MNGCSYLKSGAPSLYEAILTGSESRRHCRRSLIHIAWTVALDFHVTVEPFMSPYPFRYWTSKARPVRMAPVSLRIQLIRLRFDIELWTMLPRHCSDNFSPFTYSVPLFEAELMCLRVRIHLPRQFGPQTFRDDRLASDWDVLRASILCNLLLSVVALYQVFPSSAPVAIYPPQEGALVALCVPTGVSPYP